MKNISTERSEVDILLLISMKIYHLIELANLEQNNLTPELRWQINHEHKPNEWVSAVKYWLRGISNQHKLSGRLIGQMRDIAWDYDQWHEITPTQCLFLSNNLVDHWHHISYEYRSWVTL